MPFNQVMVDIETTGTNPNHNAMIQLSAVRFNKDRRELDMEFFDQCLVIPGNRYWSEDTRDWWATKDPKIINGIFARMQPVQRVLQNFNDWVHKDSEGKAPILWAKPTHFEDPFLKSYFEEYGLVKPFMYWQAEDLNSWCRARGRPHLDKEVEFIGDEHNAIHDVLHQVAVLFELLDTTEVSHVEDTK